MDVEKVLYLYIIVGKTSVEKGKLAFLLLGFLPTFMDSKV